MKYQVELSIVGACGGYSKIPAKHAPAVGNSVLNSPINNLGSGSLVTALTSSRTDKFIERANDMLKKQNKRLLDLTTPATQIS